MGYCIVTTFLKKIKKFIGTCLPALKNRLDYSIPILTTSQIRARLKKVLEDLLNSDINKTKPGVYFGSHN